MKIALVGSQPASVNIAPFEDRKWDEYREGIPSRWPLSGAQLPDQWVGEDWEIWGCSPGAAAHLRRCTRFFELHRWEPGKPWLSAAYVQFLREFKGPVYTGGVIPEIPNHVVYPLDRIEEAFSAYFLTSSLALMCAFAILEIEDDRRKRANGESEDVIGFWGVDMSATEEYGYQRAGCQFFILEALRRGIGIYVPAESCLLRPIPVYGLSEWGHAYIKLTQRAREMNAQKEMYAKQLQEAQTQLAVTAGALDDLNYMVNTWTSPYGLPSGTVIRWKKEHVDADRARGRHRTPDAAPARATEAPGRKHRGGDEGQRPDSLAAEPG